MTLRRLEVTIVRFTVALLDSRTPTFDIAC